MDYVITTLVTGLQSRGDKPNSYLADLNDVAFDIEGIGILRPLFYLSGGEEVEIRITSTGETKRQGITECTNNTYTTHIADPYSEHVLYLGEAKPLRLWKLSIETGGAVAELVTDGNYSITKYYVRFIREPYTVSLEDEIDCDLPTHTHHEILDITVRMMLENIESARQQTFEKQLTINE